MPITSMNLASRRSALRLSLAAAGAAVLGQPLRALAGSDKDQITVWKSPACGCCGEWVAHLQKSGFVVVTNDVKDTASVRQKLGLPDKFASCHTAQLGNYVIEGHVPAQELRRLLREKPSARGLAVPGMPTGSPGMEMAGPMAGSRDAHDVLLVLPDGNSRVYQSYSQSPPPESSVKS